VATSIHPEQSSGSRAPRHALVTADALARLLRSPPTEQSGSVRAQRGNAC
jgi:hypothetical protein